jgi:hypothetical protein
MLDARRQGYEKRPLPSAGAERERLGVNAVPRFSHSYQPAWPVPLRRAPTGAILRPRGTVEGFVW